MDRNALRPLMDLPDPGEGPRYIVPKLIGVVMRNCPQSSPRSENLLGGLVERAQDGTRALVERVSFVGRDDPSRRAVEEFRTAA